MSRGQRGGDNQRKGLKVERRDNSKTIKKGGEGKGPRKISTAELRNEKNQAKQGKRKQDGGKKGGNDKKGGKQRSGKKGRGRFGRKGDKKKEAPRTTEDLDKDLEGYWVKGGCSEFGKLSVASSEYYF